MKYRELEESALKLNELQRTKMQHFSPQVTESVSKELDA
jgi:hypothetical protein